MQIAKNKQPMFRIDRILMYVIVVFFVVIFGFPLLWTLMLSLKTIPEFSDFPPKLFPRDPQWINYYTVLNTPRVPVLRWLANTSIVTILTTIGTIITCAMVAYSFARFNYRGRDLLFTITLATMTLPAQVTLIPQFILFFKMGWVNTLEPLWVPAWFGGGAFGIFMLRQFFKTIPRDLDEAALIDGAGYARIFWSILMPLLGPAIATLGIITFIAAWSDYTNPLIYLNSPDKFTVSIGLQFFNNAPEVGGVPMRHLLMAACVLSMIPTVALFFIGQRYFVQGVVMSGIKG
jgi:multiple sugar transport system permease protein